MKRMLLLLLVFCASCAGVKQSSPYKTDLNKLKENNPQKTDSPYVVMISIDGFRHDYIEMYHPPFLSSIQDKGIRAKSLESIFPSKTFPNHYSLVTGLTADNHGLVANRFYDPERKDAYQLGNNKYTQDGSWYFGEPLWLSIKRQGLLTASYFWVGSDANIQGEHPSYYYDYDHGCDNELRTQQIVDWLKMPKEFRPHYLTLYFSVVDSAGHRFGPRSEQVKEQVLKVDKLISDMVAKIEDLKMPVNYIIVSDHGMKTIDPKKTVYLGKYEGVRYEESGPIVLGYFEEGTSAKRKKEIYKEIAKHKNIKIYPRDKRPKRWHYSKLARQGDFLVLGTPGTYIFPKEAPAVKAPKTGGTHGYDPAASPEMDGIFLSYGPNVKKSGIIPKTKNINIYPYVMNLLKLKLNTKIDGDPKALRSYIK